MEISSLAGTVLKPAFAGFKRHQGALTRTRVGMRMLKDRRKKEVGYSSAMLADGTTAVRSVPRGIRHFPPATTATQIVHDLVRPGKKSDLWTISALGQKAKSELV
jgi:hypothetical protein